MVFDDHPTSVGQFTVYEVLQEAVVIQHRS